MIRVVLAPEPRSFDQRVRTPGLCAIAEMVGEQPTRSTGKRHGTVATERNLIPPDKFPAFWREALPDLMTAYNSICAYSCFRIHQVTGAVSVDHMAAKSKAWDRVYEWDNYRLACSLLNSRKNKYDDVLDPFEIRDDWFHLELVGFQVIPHPKLTDPTIRQTILDTIGRLKLDEFRRAREERAEEYWCRDISLNWLEKESPFIARELRRQGRLNPGDA